MDDYFSASYPATWQILGVTLRPFSLGHYIKLKALGCGFVADDQQVATLGDLVVGCLVCSLPSDPDPTKDEFWTWANKQPNRFSAWFVKLLKKEPATPMEAEVMRWGVKAGMFDLAEKAKLFSDYIEAHSKVPAYWEEKREGSRSSGAHWAQAVLHTLVSKCGYSQVEALNVPVSKALADYFKQAETDGAVRLISDEESEAIGT